MADVHSSPGTEPQDVAGGPPPIMTAQDLIDALTAAAPSPTILLQNREYKVDEPLLVPDGVTVQGVGEMQFEGGLPTGFLPGTATTITAKSNLAGNLVTLGDGSSVRGLVLKGASQTGVDGEGRGGIVVAVGSRPTGSVSATIEKCELKNQIQSDAVLDGPTGGAILAYTRNPNRGGDPRPHVGATVTLTLTQSIVETHTSGKAVFAMNFASGGTVTVNLTKNDIRGPLDVIGGLSRPDAVVGATTTIISDRNRYSPQSGSNVEAWHIIGGSTPLFPAGPDSNSDTNTAKVELTDDQIEKFQVGIVAVGGRRVSSDHGTCSNNIVNLKLTRMKAATNPNPAATDFEFKGAQSFGALPAGDNNAVVVDVFAGTIPDRLFHIVVDDAGFGTGNQLAFKGKLAGFTQLSP
jgi:hypothetical protein